MRIQKPQYPHHAVALLSQNPERSILKKEPSALFKDKAAKALGTEKSVIKVNFIGITPSTTDLDVQQEPATAEVKPIVKGAQSVLPTITESPEEIPVVKKPILSLSPASSTTTDDIEAATGSNGVPTKQDRLSTSLSHHSEENFGGDLRRSNARRISSSSEANRRLIEADSESARERPYILQRPRNTFLGRLRSFFASCFQASNSSNDDY